MGFKRNPKIYHLKWEDGEYAGLEVRVRSMSLGQLVASQKGTGYNGKEGIEGNIELFAERIVDWNLETEDGEPVPTTLDAIMGEDDDLIIDIVRRWNEAMAGVPAPLPESSPSGEPSPVASIPMEPLSESLAS
ncbi:hypothetical protein [Streptomyces sp. NPDC002573]|uniref:hypothetical protein n=1 Tax=Streptomyces sp. NPDC002573 TaxID=3364651 RepID=UPI0036CF9EA7